MSDYTPPAGDAVDFTFTGGYSVPESDDVDFLYGSVATITVLLPSRTNVYADPGFNTTLFRWRSNVSGDYRIEMGGTGNNTGDLIESGRCLANMDMETIITSSDITTASGYVTYGTYRMNVYVKSDDDIWIPYD